MKVLKSNIFLWQYFSFSCFFFFPFLCHSTYSSPISLAGAQFWELWIYNTALLCDRGRFQFHANDIKFKHFGKQILKEEKNRVSYLRHFGNHLKPIFNIDDFIWIRDQASPIAFVFRKPHFPSCNRIENHRQPGSRCWGADRQRQHAAHSYRPNLDWLGGRA